MRVIAVSHLKAFWEVHAGAQAPLRNWLEVVAARFGAVYVKFIGTHAEDDRIDADTVEMP